MNRRGFFAGLLALPFAPTIVAVVAPKKLKWMDGVKPLSYWFDRHTLARQREAWVRLTAEALTDKMNALKRKAGLDTYQKT